MRITVWNLSRKVNHLSKVIRIGEPVLMMDVKVSKDKHISRWFDRENIIYVGLNRIKNHAQRRRRGSIEEKEVRHRVK